MVVKKIMGYILKFMAFLGVTVVVVAGTLLLTFNSFCNGSSETAKSLFATTMLETGQMKFIVSWFLSKEEIDEIISKNSMEDLETEVDSKLINISDKENQKDIEVIEISGATYSATLLIIKDPSKVSLATTYPWSEYGEELDKIVTSSNSIAGINGGLYVSTGNKGGYPVGVVVSNGQIQNNKTGMAGLHLIGFDKNNILRIISLKGMSPSEVKTLIEKEQIRDAVSFQDETSDKNNHFVKLIINGEKRILNGLGSGANPRTAIGQREDGTVLMLVTDGRGSSGHLGATASDLIEIMDKYGAVNAANLDGGSSSSMYYNGEYLRTSVTLYYSNSSWKIPTAFVVKENK